ncbi:hypothetical protein C6Q07_15280 [Burkholderia multivorans]|nr:hypothetical protein C6Q07_15280 [Burkholderia multivorans]
MLKTDEETIAELLLVVWQNAGPHRAGDHADTRSRPAWPRRDSPGAGRTAASYGRDRSAARAKRHTTESRKENGERATDSGKSPDRHEYRWPFESARR